MPVSRALVHPSAAYHPYRYTLRYTGGLVPDVCQQFTKKMGVFANPTSKASPAKIRLAFEAAPFGPPAGGKDPRPRPAPPRPRPA